MASATCLQKPSDTGEVCSGAGAPLLPEGMETSCHIFWQNTFLKTSFWSHCFVKAHSAITKL